MVLRQVIPWNGAAIAIQFLTYFSNTYRRKYNIIQKRNYDHEGSAAAQDVKHGKSQSKIKIHEEVLTSLCREMKHLTSNPPIE